MDMVIVVLLVVNLLAVLGVGLAVLGVLKRGGAGDATAALADLGPRLDRLSDRLNEVVRQSAVETQDRMGQAFDGFKSSVSRDLAAGRKESSDALAVLAATVSADLARGRKESAESLDRATRTLEARFEKLQASNEERLKALQEDNSKKLDQMRGVVEEKLQSTLEKRLGESFRQVSERLEQVHAGLGEMRALAGDVGDLKKVLTNVKTRGTWGEVQLGNLLEQMLTAEQYDVNVETRAGSGKRVEYAIRLPGRGEARDEIVWLPIDAKFPQEDYQRLLDAQDRADPAGVEAAGKQLELRIKGEAKDIHEKYLNPPATTDFAVMFLPSEGLYAEVLRRDGLAETLQREYRVTLAGPTTLAAMLNSLQMGFRTLAIEKRSSEVWKVLGAVKAEFGKFGEVLEKVHKQLETASNTIDTASRKSRTIVRKLRQVEQLPADEAQALLGGAEDATDDGEFSSDADHKE